MPISTNPKTCGSSQMIHPYFLFKKGAGRVSPLQSVSVVSLLQLSSMEI